MNMAIDQKMHIQMRVEARFRMRYQSQDIHSINME